MTYLLVSSSTQPVTDECSSARSLRDGYDFIPLLWWGCFREKSRRTVDVHVHESSGAKSIEHYPTLFLDKEEAIRNLTDFGNALIKIPKAKPHIEVPLADLLGAIRSSDENFVQLFDIEIQMMFEADEYLGWSSAYLLLVEDIASGKINGNAIFNTQLAIVFFDSAQIGVPEWTCNIERDSGPDWGYCLAGVVMT